MACNLTILGFDIDSKKQACIRYRVNPENYYLTCDISQSLNVFMTCSAFTDSNCTILKPESGYFAFDLGLRPYSKSSGFYELLQLEPCETSNIVKKCCGGNEVYQVSNLSNKLGYSAPVGMVINMTVTDSNNNQFTSCFEVLASSFTPSSNLFCNVVNKLYEDEKCGQCVTELRNNGTDCYLSAGNYTFENCKDSTKKITLTIPPNKSNVYQVGDVVLFNNICYFATLIVQTSPPTGTTTSIIANGCDDQLCNPVPPVVQPKSMFVSGCCDNKVYKLRSGTSYLTGTTISVSPNNYCYRVIPPPKFPSSALDLNDVLGSITTTGCGDIKCQKCSATPPTVNNPRPILNQCGVITLAPLNIECNTIDPTPSSPNSGILSVNISGGTKPYKVVWISPGGESFTGQTISNKPAGTYTVTVTDKFGTFKKTTTCTLNLILDCNFNASLGLIPSLSCDSSGGMEGYAYSSAACS